MKKINYSILFLIAVLSFIGCGSATREEGRHYEKSGRYSIALLDSWEAVEMAGLRYKILMIIEDDGSGANINFVDDIFAGDLSVYVDATIDQLSTFFGQNMQITERSDFVTLKNLKGEKLVTNSFQNNVRVRQLFYMFSGNRKTITITGTVLENAGETYDELFDRTVETFEWTR